MALIAIGAYFLLHQDFWFWEASWFLLGLPIGYTYHVLYCLGAMALMFAITRLFPFADPDPNPNPQPPNPDPQNQ